MSKKSEPDHNVLFVDDELYFAEKYIEHLRKHFSVHFIDCADEVLPYLEQHPKTKAVVLDVMMPPPREAPDAETKRGLSTGVWLLEEFPKRLGTWPFPVMVLTNRNPAGIRSELRGRKVSEKYVEVRQKLDTPAFALPDLLKIHLTRAAGER